MFGADVLRLPERNSACLGAALRAYLADELSSGRAVSWDDVVTTLAEPAPERRLRPDPRTAPVYADLARVYAACEAHALGSGPDPLPLIAGFRARRNGLSRPPPGVP